MARLPSILEKYRAEIEAELKSALAEYRSPMYDMIRYHLGWTDEKGHPRQEPAGKALRPTLCLLACESTGGDFRRALPAAAAVELAHNFSLIHDDIQDDDRERRGRPTLWSIWGKPQAINAGTATSLLSSIALSRLAEHGVPAQKQLRAQHLLEESCLKMIEGQYLDISYESRFDVGAADYLVMVEHKTAALIGYSLELGALLGTDDELVIGHFRDFGRNLALAFQIRDDVLGIWGSEEKTGKPSGSDIRHRKKSLPVVYALEHAEERARRELAKVYQEEAIDRAGLDAVLRVLNDVKAQAVAQGMAEQYRDRALAALEKMTLSPWARDNLTEIADFMVRREF